jgi:hypothetical protein
VKKDRRKASAGGSHLRADDPLNVTNILTPLNRMVDALPPESATARQFNGLAKQIAAGNGTSQQWRQARQWLVRWRDNDAILQPTLGQSSLTEELVPLSHSLNRVAVIGLQALDDLQNHHSVSTDTLQQNIAYLESAQKPQADLILMVAPSVELLLKAAGPQSSTRIKSQTFFAGVEQLMAPLDLERSTEVMAVAVASRRPPTLAGDSSPGESCGLGSTNAPLCLIRWGCVSSKEEKAFLLGALLQKCQSRAR